MPTPPKGRKGSKGNGPEASGRAGLIPGQAGASSKTEVKTVGFVAFDSQQKLPMGFDPQFALDPMLSLAKAAYDPKQLPSDWNLIQTIQPDNFGFVAESKLANIVSFRGTQSEAEWLRDFDAIPVEAKIGEGHVHKGFQEQYFRLRDSVQHGLRWTTRPLWITGHSLGAALAVLCAADFSDKNPLVYTFEGPRVGMVIWSSWFDKQVKDCYRVVNIWDPVPHLPPFLDYYKHVGKQVLIDPGFTDDVHISHGLDSACKPGLERLITAKAA